MEFMPYVVLFILVVMIWSIYNGIINRKNAVERAWAGVINQERQRLKVLPELERIASEYKEFESSLLEEIISLRSGVDKKSLDKMGIKDFRNIETKMNSILEGFKLTVEAYPDLKSVMVFQDLFRETAERHENISAAIRIFNSNIEAFNAGIQVFPNNLVNAMLNREKKLDVFSDSEASSGFEYKPNF